MEIVKKKVGAGFGVMLLKDNKILLGRRHVDPEKADSELRGEGTWIMPGGKLEFGESFEDGGRREVLEETGIVANNIRVLCVGNDKNEHAHFVTIGLIADVFNGDPKVMEPDEIVEWRWFDIDDLPKPLFFPSAKIIENYKKNLFYTP
ncbi:MAG: NUDIX domain-containing protein [Candidatus Paceibacterota bacterium]|jgi:ADP-ribose pyrophosphatase YjhB (NUDIX family)